MAKENYFFPPACCVFHKEYLIMWDDLLLASILFINYIFQNDYNSVAECDANMDFN